MFTSNLYSQVVAMCLTEVSYQMNTTAQVGFILIK